MRHFKDVRKPCQLQTQWFPIMIELWKSVLSKQVNSVSLPPNPGSRFSFSCISLTLEDRGELYSQLCVYWVTAGLENKNAKVSIQANQIYSIPETCPSIKPKQQQTFSQQTAIQLLVKPFKVSST